MWQLVSKLLNHS